MTPGGDTFAWIREYCWVGIVLFDCLGPSGGYSGFNDSGNCQNNWVNVRDDAGAIYYITGDVLVSFALSPIPTFFSYSTIQAYFDYLTSPLGHNRLWLSYLCLFLDTGDIFRDMIFSLCGMVHFSLTFSPAFLILTPYIGLVYSIQAHYIVISSTVHLGMFRFLFNCPLHVC